MSMRGSRGRSRGQYGSGTVMQWDEGTWEPVGGKDQIEDDRARAISTSPSTARADEGRVAAGCG